MAPSNMFSYLRSGYKNRSTSNLASPDPSGSSAQPGPSPSVQSTDYFHSPRPGDNAVFNSGSPVSPYPPQLPPIPRVASRLDRSSTSSIVTSPPQPASPSPDHTEYISQVVEEHGSRPSSRPGQSQSLSGFRTPGQSLAQVVEEAVRPDTQHTTKSSLLSPSTISSNYSAHSRSQTSLFSGLSEKMTNGSKSTATPVPPQKTGKSRLNLRNPMSLLMRRRSGQTVEQLSDESLVSHRSSSIVPPMPDNYDPSIRGRIVHDFSAPRTNRSFSYNNAYGGEKGRADSRGEADRYSPPKSERGHTPVFREHFDDDTSYEISQAAIRAEQLANRDFLARNSMPPPQRSPPPLPPVSKDSPLVHPPQPSLSPPPPPPEQVIEFQSSVLSTVQESPSPADGPALETPKKRKSAKTPPASRSRATSVTDPSFTPAGLPTPLTSKSSRFSFQIAGSDSAEERLLEERHKQKAAEKASKEVRMSTNTIGDEYDEYGMDDFDMDDGYEEEIPMLGDDDGFGVPTMSPGMSAFDFSSINIPMHINSMSPNNMGGDLQTPRDANGNAIGFAVTADMHQKTQLSVGGLPTNGASAHVSETQGLGLLDVQQGIGTSSTFTPVDTPEDARPAAEPGPTNRDLGDDLYFDDGMIEEQGELDDGEFDENVFDDPEHPLYERKMKPAPPEELRNALSSNPPDVLRSETGYEADDDFTRHLDESEPSLAHRPSGARQGPTPAGLSGLNAYHSALADAANRAEAEGRFVRKASIDIGQTGSENDDSSLSNSRPSLIPDDGRFSQETTGFPPDDDGFGMSPGFVDDYDYSEYDSALEDDPMIAAANAEALANDYEGFYGQEFGFYANAQGEAVTAYGGFFGPSGLGRSVSGRNAVREPNLTPITERSEYSTRNSFISINHFRDGQQPIQSPALAQLARISPYGWREDDPDMSLDTLMKLRKGAFGGSTVSLGSSSGNSPRNSSPMGMQYIPRTASPMANHPMANSEEALDSDDSPGVEDMYDGDEDDEALDAVNAISGESDEDGEDGPESPTLTASDYNSLSSPTSHLTKDMQLMPPPPLPIHSPPLPPPLTLSTTFYPAAQSIDTNLSSPALQSASGSAPRRQSLGLTSPVSTTSPMTPSGGAWKAGHSRKTSAADSVTYVREHDEQGGDRWVLERRRTAESGELELIGREIVEGGRI